MLPDWLNPKVWIASIFKAKYVNVIVRKTLDVMSAGLLAIGVSQGATNQLVLGVEPALVELLSMGVLALTTAWSLADKKKNQD